MTRSARAARCGRPATPAGSEPAARCWRPTSSRILAAVVLYLLSVGSVRGFAFVLGLTTIIDIIVAFWFTHPLTVILGRTRWMQGGSKWTGLDTARMGGHAATGAAATSSRRRSTTKEVSS